MVAVLALLLLLVTAPVLAQALPEPPREAPAMRGLALALQQMAVATEQYIGDVNRRLAEKDVAEAK